MKLIQAVIAFFLFFIIDICHAQDLQCVVSDEDMEYRPTTDEAILKFVRHWPGDRLTAADIRLIHETCRTENIGVVWALARAQGEQGVVVNFDDWHYEIRKERFFSYGLSIVKNGISPFLGFSNQVTNAIHRMRELANEWRPGARAPVNFYGNVECLNAATYSLHRYNCRWGAASNFGVYNEGNSLFIRILRDFQIIWLSIAEAK